MSAQRASKWKDTFSFSLNLIVDIRIELSAIGAKGDISAQVIRRGRAIKKQAFRLNPKTETLELYVIMINLRARQCVCVCVFNGIFHSAKDFFTYFTHVAHLSLD